MRDRIELDLLAALVANGELVPEAGGLTGEHFTHVAHVLTLEALRAIYGAGVPVDARTLRSELERTGNLAVVGGPAFIGSLVNGFPRLQSLRPLLAPIEEASMKRTAGVVCSDLRVELDEEEVKPGEAIARAVAKLSRLAEGGTEATSCEGADLLRACTGALESLLSGKGAGVSTGVPSLDALGVTLTPGEVTVLAAGTSRGKSAAGAQIAYSVAKGGARAMFASLEMSRAQTLRRFVAHEAGIPLDVMRANATDPEMVQRLTRAASRVSSSGLIVADLTRDTRLSRLIASAQAAKARGGLDVLVIDYLGLLNLDGARGRSSRYEITTELSREVKLAALRLNLATVLLVQFSREPEKREGGRPQLSDLRDSGAIEQDADTVLLIHRGAGSIEGALIVAKNRNGPLGEVPVSFDGATFTFRQI